MEIKSIHIQLQPIIVMGIAIAFISLAPRNSLAQWQNTSEQKLVPAGTTVTGTVQSVDTGRGEIQVKDELGDVNTYTISNTAMTGITGETIDMSGIKTGDPVTIQVGTDNQASELKVTQ